MNNLLLNLYVMILSLANMTQCLMVVQILHNESDNLEVVMLKLQVYSTILESAWRGWQKSCSTSLTTTCLWTKTSTSDLQNDCYSFNYSVFSTWITTRISRNYLLSWVHHKFNFYFLNVAVKYLHFGTLIKHLLHIHILCRCCWVWFHLMYLSNFHPQIWLFFPFDLHSIPAALLSKLKFRLHVCCSHVKSGRDLLMLTMLVVVSSIPSQYTQQHAEDSVPCFLLYFYQVSLSKLNQIRSVAKHGSNE
jgi:hypothetical protein